MIVFVKIPFLQNVGMIFRKLNAIHNLDTRLFQMFRILIIKDILYCQQRDEIADPALLLSSAFHRIKYLKHGLIRASSRKKLLSCTDGTPKIHDFWYYKIII